MNDSTSALVGDVRRAWLSFAVTVVGAVVIGAAVALSVDDAWLDERPLVFQIVTVLGAFSLYCATYAIVTWRVLRRLQGDELKAALLATTPRTRAARLSRLLSGGGAGSWSVTAAVAALGLATALAFVTELRDDPAILAMTGFTVVTSWLLVPTSYAVEYLREDAAHDGLRFPGDQTLCFANYFYLAMQVSTTFSTSDVEVTTVAMRRRVIAQSLVGFVFSSVIIALVVSAILTAASR